MQYTNYALTLIFSIILTIASISTNPPIQTELMMDNFLFDEEVMKTGFSLVNQSIQSFGKGSRFFNDSPLQLSRDSLNQSQANWSSSSTCQFGTTAIQSLCCRTFFTQGQIIPQPESDICQYKSYTFPFNRQKNQTIQKTICGFLNCNGGHIFIGIQQNILTKQHKVVGGTYNEGQKEQILKVIRSLSESIEPDIIINNKIKINFVPVKICLYPYSFIPGRFIIKIKVSPGVRDQVYTVNTDGGDVFVCIRTQNQILTYDTKKEFRRILSIQKERAQYPLEKPRKLHKYDCKKPQQGIRLFQQSNRMIKPKRPKSPKSNTRKHIDQSNTSNISQDGFKDQKQNNQTHNQKIRVNLNIARPSIMSRQRDSRRKDNRSTQNQLSSFQQIQTYKCTKSKQISSPITNPDNMQLNQTCLNLSADKSAEINKSNDSRIVDKKKKKKNKKKKSQISQNIAKNVLPKNIQQNNGNRQKKYTKQKSSINQILNLSYQTPPKTEGKVIDKLKFVCERVVQRVYNSPEDKAKKNKITNQVQQNSRQRSSSTQQQIVKNNKPLGSDSSRKYRKQQNKNTDILNQTHIIENINQFWLQKKQKEKSVRQAAETAIVFEQSNEKKKKKNKKVANPTKTFEKKKASTYHKLNILNYLVSKSKKSYLISNSNQNIHQFIAQLKSVNQSNHRIFAFSGFSTNRIEIILSQFASIGQYTYFQFQNLLVYKFNKDTNESVLKLALTKALKHQYVPNVNIAKDNSFNINNGIDNSPYYHQAPIIKDIQYHNTAHKKNNTNLNLSLNQSQLQSITQEPNKNYNQYKQTRPIRIIFKITTRLKILKYNLVDQETRNKIRQIITMIEDLTAKKNGPGLKFYFEKNHELPKNKQLEFSNLYYSLLAYLQLRYFDITLIFY